MLYITTNSFFDAVSCEFTYNYANQTSTIEVLRSSTLQNNTIKTCNFDRNTAVKNTLSLMYSKVVIENSYFTYNQASERTKNIFVGFSDVVVTGSMFRSTIAKNRTE